MKTSEIVLVGFTTRPRSDAENYLPDFQPNKNTKDRELMEKQVEAKRLSFMAGLADKPYLGELERVCLAYIDLDAPANVRYAEFDRDELGLPLADAVCNVLCQWFKGRITSDGSTFVESPVRFVGFKIRLFAKMLGLECAELDNNSLPHSFWFNADYRDVSSMALPSPECDNLTIDLVISRLGIKMPDKMSFEPGDDPMLDTMVSASIVQKLNIFPKANETLKLIAQRLLDAQRNHMADMGLPTPSDEEVTSAYVQAMTSPVVTPLQVRPTARKKSTKK